MVKVTTTIVLDAELREMARARGVVLSKFFNDMLKSYLFEPADKEIQEAKDVREIKSLIKKNEQKLTKTSSTLVDLKERLRKTEKDLEKKQENKRKEEIIFYD